MRNVLKTDSLYRFYKIGNKTLQNYPFYSYFEKKKKYGAQWRSRNGKATSFTLKHFLNVFFYFNKEY